MRMRKKKHGAERIAACAGLLIQPPEPGIAAPPPDPQDVYLQRADAAELEQTVRALREPYGRVATLYLLEEKPVAEIARLLGRPPATVQNQLFRAKMLLRKQLTERRQAP